VSAVIHLLGFPAAGKLTVANELASQYQQAGIETRVIDNHHTANVIFPVLPVVDGVRPLPPTVWDHVNVVRGALYAAIREFSPPEWIFVFTNVIWESEGVSLLDPVRSLAAARAVPYVPVRLVCDIDELAKRIVSPERAVRMKMTSAGGVRSLHERETLLDPGLPNTLTLDTTTATAATTAAAIRAHVSSL
jgi:hypothetical protein